MEKRGFFLNVKFLIAEVGNCHFGSIESAKEHIETAKECGASAVKLQAFNADDISGSMPKSFYKQCQLDIDSYLELIEYGQTIGIPVFYSVFTKGFEPILNKQSFWKVSAGQIQHKNAPYSYPDEGPVFISFNKKTELFPIKKSQILYATDYMPRKLDIDYIGKMKEFFGRPVGLSDHHVGIDACIRAHKKYGVHVIEKHFTLEKNVKYQGKVFRDTVHGCDPKQLYKLSRAVK